MGKKSTLCRDTLGQYPYIGFIGIEGEIVKIGLRVKTAYRLSKNPVILELLHQKVLYLITIIY